jgi:alpha-galactosidase
MTIFSQLSYAVDVTSEEIDAARQWAAVKFETSPLPPIPLTKGGQGGCDKGEKIPEPPFSFIYGGQSSGELLKTWDLERTEKEIDEYRTQQTLTYTDSKTDLEVRCVGVVWKDYPTVEWTVYFKNSPREIGNKSYFSYNRSFLISRGKGATDTPIIESIQAIDTIFERGSEGEFVLHHHIGDKCTIDSFAPVQTILSPNVSKKFAPDGGRPTNGQWPYYNLERPDEREGVIIVIGWPGQWASQFIRDSGVGLRVIGGQELTHLKLHPGEEIRTPLIVLQFYKGDWIRAQNIWRRWMFAHNFPKDHGKPLSPKHGAASVWYYGFQCTQAGDIEFINLFAEKGIPLDYWWMDAGWYPCNGSWPVTGTWEADKTRFPNGLKAVTDASRKHGGETIIWFEVERVHSGTWVTQNHPEWVHGGAGGGLLKMDEPEVVQWVTDHIDKMISEEGIDLYRSDFNIDPLAYWRGNDTEDRQGITEIRYIEGYLSYWDELRRRHPGMLIDSCASGGRRDDLETMRRAVPLLRSDLENNPEVYQCHTYGFGLWLPYFDATNYEKFDNYYFRSTIAPFLQCNWDIRKPDFDAEQAKKCLKQWRSVADYYFGDFWPLSDYSTASNVWMAWQFDRPDLGEGLIQAFRRPDCPYVSAQYKLQALESDALYIVSACPDEIGDLDTDRPRQMTGRELMQDGLIITISQQPGAALITYKALRYAT